MTAKPMKSTNDKIDLKNGDVVIQKKLTDVQQAGEGIFDNWRWVVINGECVAFDGKAHCSIPFLQESEYEVVGNIAKLIQETLQECIDSVLVDIFPDENDLLQNHNKRLRKHYSKEAHAKLDELLK